MRAYTEGGDVHLVMTPWEAIQTRDAMPGSSSRTEAVFDALHDLIHSQPDEFPTFELDE